MTRQTPLVGRLDVRSILLAAGTLLVAGGLVVVGLGLRASPALGSNGNVRLTNPDVVFVAAFTDDAGIDPGHGKDVAGCVAVLEGPDTVAIGITNGYPGYSCRPTLTIENIGDVVLRRAASMISTAPALTVTTEEAACGDLHPGGQAVVSYAVRINQDAAQNATYRFTIAARFLEAEPGTIGFWKNWDEHASFAAGEIEGWLQAIDGSSDWLGPTTVEAMNTLFETAQGRASSEARFLVHYLATRLNDQAGLLCAAAVHDITTVDRDNYLELEDPEHVALVDIINAVESKTGTSLTRPQYNLLKALFDGLNNAAL